MGRDDHTVGLHDCDYRWEVELNVIVGAKRAVISLDCQFPTLPGSTLLLRVFQSA